MAQASKGTYYVPVQSKWPIIASIGLFTTLLGAGILLNNMSAGVEDTFAHYIFFGGVLIMTYMLIGWFGHVIQESQQELYSAQMDRSFRLGMVWFIFSEIMFFLAFLGTLFYVRYFSVPWLAGEGDNIFTHEHLWPEFQAQWPLVNNPDNKKFPGATGVVNPFRLPMLNTLILLASSITLTIAHHALLKAKRTQVKIYMILTLILGLIFLYCQGKEYIAAYNHLALTLHSGIYGSTFFILTGFHGVHVTLGAFILLVVLIRVYKKHFQLNKHFAFEAATWYWHFVDVLWISLFIFVYLI